MPCPDCKDHATPEEIAAAIHAHGQRLQAEFERQLSEAVADMRHRLEVSIAEHERRHHPLH